MSSSLYGKGSEKIVKQTLNLLTDTIKAVAVKSAYTPDLTAHEFLSDLGANTIGAAQTLTTKSVTAAAGKAVFDADDVTFAALAAGSTVKGIALYKDTGVAGTSPLIAWIDSVDVLPYATTGNSLLVQWDNTVGGNFIFAI